MMISTGYIIFEHFNYGTRRSGELKPEERGPLSGSEERRLELKTKRAQKQLVN
jgi:hypothetical protein